MDVLDWSPSAWRRPACHQTVNVRDCLSPQPFSPLARMSTVSLGFLIEVVSSRSGVMCNYILRTAVFRTCPAGMSPWWVYGQTSFLFPERA